MKKLLSFIAILGFLSTATFAEDFLAKVTNGAVSDYDEGVRRLSVEEERQVVGGYTVGFMQISQNEIAVLALPDFENELGWSIKNGQIDIGQTMQNDKGLCAMGVTQCYSNRATKKHLWQSQKRLQDFIQALDNGNPLYTALGFSVKRNIGVGRNGRFVYFSYGVVAVNRLNGDVRNVTNSATLNHNVIINELKRAHKGNLEQALGGYYIR